MPIRLAPLAPSSSGDETESNASSSVSVVPSVRSTTEPVMRHYNVLEAGLKSHAALRTCMEEREFHIEIAKEKKTINNKVKMALHNRPPLHYPGGRVKHIPLR
ncbi:hypothetical protein NP493_115g03018 [Ridgeia piscesae]|uniref:Uncharacterized protein n=1 Tax=Ridgeia piscesae TaxID=27915 RepID=A0AAD9UH18_RIDPI|nr:hypothetical protein NP493_115g03018 [Ridgeia piscesae]